MRGAAPQAPPPPRARFQLAVTGHRRNHPCFSSDLDSVTTTLSDLFEAISASLAVTPTSAGPVRLHCLLADGTDQVAATLALARGWELVCPLPFGRVLNAAINSHALDVDEARSLLAGDPAIHAPTRANLTALNGLADQARLFELAEQDDRLRRLYLDALGAPGDSAAAVLFRTEAAARVAVAGQILIEQADLLIAWWDGATCAPVGGTGHTVHRALACGTPVLWIDPSDPASWTIVTTPEAIAAHTAARGGEDMARLNAILAAAMAAGDEGEDESGIATGHRALSTERWHPRSSRWWHAYRRVEALFGEPDWRGRLGRLTQVYESPEQIATASGSMVMGQIGALTALPGDFAASVDHKIMRRFAWADGISARLSDCYRSGMTINFLLSALAISGGIAYLPLVSIAQKWGFALFELALLLLILGITAVGQRRRWHDRWFETRRVAEYLRHAPVLLTLGVARPVARWSGGADAGWPEHYAKAALRSIGLPKLTITADFLRQALTGLFDGHVVRQRDYHRLKAARLAAVHHNLDHASTWLFIAAVLSVTVYLALTAMAGLGMMPHTLVEKLSKMFTVLGVVLPTFGAAIAGIRYFGDFERFSAISEVAADKLDAIHHRITALAAGPDDALTYARVADLAHAADEVVVAEIESWQAVFAGKHVAVPV